MWIERQISARLQHLAATRPVLVVTGARQTGKTALIRHLFAGHHYVSLDLPSEAAQAEQDPAAFLARHPLPLVVDEVQYAPGLLRHLKTVVDAARQRNGQLILSGSQPFTLMQGISESLAGRAAIVQLEGLSSAELSSGRPIEGHQLDWPTWLLRGGFPELSANAAINASEYFASYVATYLERDLRSQLQVSSLHDFERFLRAAALRSAQVLNRAELARDVGISNSTAGIWLALLQRSGLVVLLEPWFSNATKRLVKAPKLYVADSGLLTFLIGLSRPDDLLRSPLLGAVWETAVLMDLRRQAAACGDGAPLFFWRDRNKEIDLLLQRGGRFWLADAKWCELPQAGDGRRLRQLAAEIGADQVAGLALICRTANRFGLGDGVEALPLGEAGPWFGLAPGPTPTLTRTDPSPPPRSRPGAS
jgi:predicted AAA+ superfamily ATPase